ncbi:hypothetical protein HYU50_05230 [Candidatus Woesearchaeota archaeon]|nr:hypothetical protein [Candidatus Woesearchaeota archaeon]
MDYLTIALFFVYTFCLGFTASSFVKNSENFLERNLMRIGFGLSLLPFLALALNIIKIPADWRIILALSLAYPLYYLSRNYNKFNFSFKLTKTNLSIFLMLILFFINFYIYGTGAFNYPYLEDDDSWGHANGVKFYSMEKNAFLPEAEHIRYMNPYPPSYDIMLGILHQTNDSVYWTIKFFNALIISLSTIFFYFFVREFTGDRNKALFSAFALLSIPAFMSHFIWGISLTVPLYFVIFYAMERIKHDRKWWILAALVMVTAFTSSPTHGTYFGLFFVLYFLAKTLLQRKFLVWDALAGISGAALSFIFWWIPMFIRYGVSKTLKSLGIQVGTGAAAFGVGGTADRVYTFKDFFFAQKQNMINNPIGIGIVLSILVVIALAYIIFNNMDAIKKNKKIFLSSFLILTSAMILLLFFTYTKEIWVDGNSQPIQFSVFISDQMFLVITLIFSILAISALIVSDYTNSEFKDRYLIITLVWFGFLFYAVNAAPFKFKLSPFRAWMLLAIPVCTLAAEGTINLMQKAKGSIGGIGKLAVLILLITGMYFTSTQQKIAVNTATWPPGAFWTSGEEITAYLWMKENLPKNSKVFAFSHDDPVIGSDMFSCSWCKGVLDYRKTGFNDTAQEKYNWLKSKDYEYLIIDGRTAKTFGANETNSKIQEIAQSGLFRPIFQNQGAVIFQI